MITTESMFAILFLLGIIFGYALCKFETQPLDFRAPRPKREPKLTAEEQATEQFLAIMTDDTLDDMRLQKYQPRRVRNRAPLAITASPSTTSANMRSIKHWMEDTGSFDKARIAQASRQ